MQGHKVCVGDLEQPIEDDEQKLLKASKAASDSLMQLRERGASFTLMQAVPWLICVGKKHQWANLAPHEMFECGIEDIAKIDAAKA